MTNHWFFRRWVYELVVIEGRSLDEVGKKFGVSGSAIRSYVLDVTDAPTLTHARMKYYWEKK